MCDTPDLDRRTFLKTVPGAAVLAGEFVYGHRAHAQGQPLKIGAPQPMTGPDAPFGDKFKKAYGMAVEEINQAGGLLGKRVRVLVEDDQGKPEEAQTVVTKLINKDRVVAVLGEVASSNSLAGAPV